jgi:hypothetical protein
VNQAVKGVIANYDALVDLFGSTESSLSRLEIYTKIPFFFLESINVRLRDKIPFTWAMTDIVVKLMVEVLSTLALATKQVNQGRLSESLFR